MKEIHKNWDVFINEGHNIIVASVICIDEEGRILILKRSETAPRRALLWDLPGGHVDQSDNSIEAGGIRELEEEAGLSASPGDLTYIDKTMRGRMLRYFFATREWTGNVKLVPNPKTDILEHIEYKWATIEDIEGLADPSFPDYILRKALVKMRNSNE